jgi:hypothetical protein
MCRLIAQNTPPKQPARSKRMPARLTAALRRFASRSAQLEREILKNPDFRSLCEDYGEAVDALDHWSKSAHPLSGQRVAEYQHLALELEQEIESYLDGVPSD